MLTQEQVTDIFDLIELEKIRLGGLKEVSVKCGVEIDTLIQIINGSFLGNFDLIIYEIGLSLGYSFKSELWNIAEITNYNIVMQVLADSRSETMFMGIASCAGSGKTATANCYIQLNSDEPVYLIRAREWGARTFLINIASKIGVTFPESTYITVNLLIELITIHLNRHKHLKPHLIIDQANSLKESALKTIVHLFNDCEDNIGFTILGTDALENEIKRGVRLNRPGYDELDSRFGRVYVHLIGATLLDCRKICEANGITDQNLQKEIFDRCEPVKKVVKDENGHLRSINVIEDIRRIKRIVIVERLK